MYIPVEISLETGILELDAILHKGSHPGETIRFLGMKEGESFHVQLVQSKKMRHLQTKNHRLPKLPHAQQRESEDLSRVL